LASSETNEDNGSDASEGDTHCSSHTDTSLGCGGKSLRTTVHSLPATRADASTIHALAVLGLVETVVGAWWDNESIVEDGAGSDSVEAGHVGCAASGIETPDTATLSDIGGTEVLVVARVEALTARITEIETGRRSLDDNIASSSGVAWLADAGSSIASTLSRAERAGVVARRLAALAGISLDDTVAIGTLGKVARVQRWVVGAVLALIFGGVDLALAANTPGLGALGIRNTGNSAALGIVGHIRNNASALNALGELALGIMGRIGARFAVVDWLKYTPSLAVTERSETVIAASS